jgi:CRP-like cAMP-binding protein
MEQLIAYFQKRISLNSDDIILLQKIITTKETPSKTVLIKEGKIENHLYFLTSGIVKGYKINNDKIVIEHLVENNNFFTSIDSFINNTVSKEYFETITDCSVCKISITHLNTLKATSKKWSDLIEVITHENLRCKMERVSDFQTLTAKERYLKFIKNSPHLALNVSIENIASFLGMEPQSLSRIRKQITI